MSEDIKKIREMMEFLVKQKISKIIGDEKEKKIYEFTGEKGQGEITKSLTVSSKTLSKLWKKWEDEGIIIKEGKSYRKVI